MAGSGYERRKIWSILALAALTGSLLAGCGEVKTEEQTKETKQEEKPAELLVAAAACPQFFTIFFKLASVSGIHGSCGI